MKFQNSLLFPLFSVGCLMSAALVSSIPNPMSVRSYNDDDDARILVGQAVQSGMNPYTYISQAYGGDHDSDDIPVEVQSALRAFGGLYSTLSSEGDSKALPLVKYSVAFYLQQHGLKSDIFDKFIAHRVGSGKVGGKVSSDGSKDADSAWIHDLSHQAYNGNHGIIAV